MLRNFGDLDKATRHELTEKIAPRLDFEEQVTYIYFAQKELPHKMK